MVADVGRTLHSLTEWCHSTDLAFETVWYTDVREQITAPVDCDPRTEVSFVLERVLPSLCDGDCCDYFRGRATNTEVSRRDLDSCASTAVKSCNNHYEVMVPEAIHT